jgi:Mg/Co/Ni transporter MgtE
MKTVVGVYESHDKAIIALQELKKTGFTADKLSLVGKADLVDNHINIKANNAVEKTEASIGVVAGAILAYLRYQVLAFYLALGQLWVLLPELMQELLLVDSQQFLQGWVLMRRMPLNTKTTSMRVNFWFL